MAQARRVLVTGAAGFIGSHVAAALVRRGDDVVGLDSFDAFYGRGLKERNRSAVEAAAEEPGAGSFELVEDDIRDAGVAERAVGGAGSVVHLAARAGVRPSIAEPALYADVNVRGTTLLLEAARTSGVDRFVLASSSSVYGNAEKVPFAETDDVSRPISPYAATKAACEHLAWTYHHLYELPIASLRFFTVFGPRQRPDLAIAKFLERVARGEAIEVFGDGSTSRDYTFIEDIVSGVLAAHDRIPEHGCRVWNLGGSEPTSLAEMVATVERVVGERAVIERKPMQPGDVVRTYADLTRSRAELGFEPRTGFEAGVRAQWAELRERLAGSAGAEAAR